MTKQRIAAIISALVVICAVLFFAWKWMQPGIPSKKSIAVVLPSDRNPFWIEVRRGAEKAASELNEGFQVSIAASNDQDATSQKTILDNYYTRKQADALVLGPADDHAMVENVR